LHLYELFVDIQGQKQYLWRAAERLFCKLLKGQESKPWQLITDKFFICEFFAFLQEVSGRYPVMPHWLRPKAAIGC